MKILFSFLFLMIFSGYAQADRGVVATDSKKFQTMKMCISWLDSKFKNVDWHKNGYAWELIVDSPHEVIGATFMPSKTVKNKFHPVAITCTYTQTGTKGNYFEGTYSILELR